MSKYSTPIINKFLSTLIVLCENLALGKPANEDELFQLTRPDAGPKPFVRLAEAFGLMLVKTLAREEENANLIHSLRNRNATLTAEHQKLVYGNIVLQQAMQHSYDPKNVVAQCAVMRSVIQLALSIARRPINTLILGPTGAGKEVIAKLIHTNSPHRDGPFIAVNCTAIPESLFESEMFGIEKGVATGVLARKGIIEEAHGGTLFLDEVAEMSMVNQAKLLRVLEERQVVRVGSSKPIPVSMTIVAATHVPLAERVRTGNFREDLYYRINVAEIPLPPLRERGDDILLLARLFLDRHCATHHRSRVTISPEVQQALLQYAWPGNVRELNNEMERVAALSPTDTLALTDLSLRVQMACGVSQANAPAVSEPPPLTEDSMNLDKSEELLIQRVLHHTKGNRTHAAKLLGVTREGLRKKLMRLGL